MRRLVLRAGSVFLMFLLFSCSDFINEAESFIGASTHWVEDSRALIPVDSTYSIGRYETTYGDWYEVMEWALQNGFRFKNHGELGGYGYVGIPPLGSQMPVTNLTAGDILVWLNAYSMMTGFLPVYYSDAGRTAVLTDASSVKSVYMKDMGGFRLPTEEEWVKAFRGGNPDADAWKLKYAGSNNLDLVAVYESSHSEPVGTKQPNALGLYDMSGNVYEAVLSGGYFRAKGGSYGAGEKNCTHEFLWTSSVEFPWIGFRVARSN